MDSQEFCNSAEILSRFLAKYISSNPNERRGKRILTNVKPGYMDELMEEECPKKGTNFERIFQEIKSKIMPGVTNWNSPFFNAYFPAGMSYASVLSELLIAGLNTVDVNWEACPASVELEVQVLNWLAKMLNLPKEFYAYPKSLGGGVLQTTSGESTLLSIISARNCTLKNLKLQRSDLDIDDLSPKLICYTSTEAHFSVQRATAIAGIKLRLLPSDSEGSLRGSTLKDAINDDINQGRIPFCVVATLGTTNVCTFDNISELGPICKRFGLWLHVDAAYAGSALVCPEFRYISKGLEYADSFAVGLHKWMYMSYDVVALWLKNRYHLKNAVSVDAIYIKDEYLGSHLDLQHMQIGTGRKFRSLKVWMVLKSHGLEDIQEMIRRHVRLGDRMAELMSNDQRFEIITANFGMVAFCLKSGNKATEILRTLINDRGLIILTPSEFHGKYLIRFVINYSTKEDDVDFAWSEIQKNADKVEENLKMKKMKM